MCRQHMFFDALSSADVVLQRMKCVNRTLKDVKLKGDPLSPEVRSIVAAAVIEHQIRCEEVIPFPSDYDPKQYPLNLSLRP